MSSRWLFARRTVGELHAESERSGLRRALGPMDLVMMGVGAIIGAGIFGTIGQAAGAAGPAVVLSFLVTAFACGLAGLCYAELTSVVPISGSAYTYAYATLGQFVAWIIGWDLILEYAIGNVGVAISWADYAWALMKNVGIDFPLWLAKDPRYLTDPLSDPATVAAIRASAPTIGGTVICFNLLAVSITVLITILLVRGVRHSATLNNAIVLLKIGVLLFVIGVGIQYWDTSRWGLAPYDSEKFAPHGWTGIAKGAGLLFFSYIGFDAVSTAAEESKKPARDLPIGILGSLAICTVLYVLIGLVVTALVPIDDLTRGADPLNVAISATGKDWAKVVVSVGATASMTAVLLVFQMGQPRILMSMSRDGLLPPFFARVSQRYGTPAVSTVLTGIVVCTFSAFANIVEIVNLVNIGTLFAFVVVCIGTLVLRYKEPDLVRPFRVRGIWPVALGGVLTCTYLMTQLGAENWSRLALWLVVGLNAYFAYGFVRNTTDPVRRRALQRRANVVFALVLTGLAAFMLHGDEWLSAPAIRASELAPGETLPAVIPTLWDKWVGFPPELAHGMAVFLGLCALWNLASIPFGSRPQNRGPVAT
ncbi:MAG: amino acid permease [Planctomycetota bacterium]|nr:amino acid permease [Planctomycetota bacterium]